MICTITLNADLAYATAAGTAAMQGQGIALCQKKDFGEILPQVKVEAGDIEER